MRIWTGCSTNRRLRPLPPSKNASWVKNPIDAFILSETRSQGPDPGTSRLQTRTPPARLLRSDRRAANARRGAGDFENDHAPDAYEKVIDKLLADTRYGERWARHWLDLARFAESDGFAIDGERPPRGAIAIT